jgi:aspartyl-tRNA(Asn)/glutamyl-tRNA(Gln) amidotransferase subunit C
MAVTPSEVRHLAVLARLSLEPGDLEPLTADLNRILEHMDELAAAGNGEATAGRSSGDGAAPAPAGTRLRADEPGADALAHPPAAMAPAWEQGFFLVPRLASHDTSGGLESTGPEAP